MVEEPASGEQTSRHRETLPRRRILRRRAVIQELRAHGCRRSNRWLVLLIQPAGAGEESQAAFFTPKRIGAAHVRNQLRRRMREIYRRFIAPESGLMPGQLWLWSARPEAAKLDFAALKEAMLQLSNGQKSSRRGP